MNFTYASHAKLNLFLDVAEKRADGYHDIETIFQSISLHDTLQFQGETTGITVECSSTEVGDEKNNLVYQAAQLLQSQCGCTRGVRISLEKQIPVAAGLAGGSGNAAATLDALNTLWKLDLSRERLRELALRLGSDVPFCLEGGTAGATGRGEQLKRLPDLSNVWFVLVHPQISVSTAHAYSRLGERSVKRSLNDAIEALRNQDWGELLFNRFESPLFEEYPKLARLKEDLVRAGCAGALMSGSGPTIFGICDSELKARGVVEAFEGESLSISQPVGHGVRPLG